MLIIIKHNKVKGLITHLAPAGPVWSSEWGDIVHLTKVLKAENRCQKWHQEQKAFALEW